jgi:hypothetical protein
MSKVKEDSHITFLLNSFDIHVQHFLLFTRKIRAKSYPFPHLFFFLELASRRGCASSSSWLPGEGAPRSRRQRGWPRRRRRSKQQILGFRGGCRRCRRSSHSRDLEGWLGRGMAGRGSEVCRSTPAMVGRSEVEKKGVYWAQGSVD